MSAFLHDHLHREDLDWLFTGRLVVSYERASQRWTSWYESRLGSAIFQLHLEARHSSYLLGEKIVALVEHLVQEWQQASNAEKILDPHQRVLQKLEQGEGVYLQVQRPQQGYDLPTHYAFEAAAGMTWEQRDFCPARVVFEWVLKPGFVFTENVRRVLKQGFRQNELQAQTINLSDGEDLALFLFRLKNGLTPNERQAYRAIQDTFRSLTDRGIEVGVRFPPQFGQQRSTTPLEADVFLEVHITSERGDIPLEFSGAGLSEALLLSTLIASSTGQVVLLDEPALNLHPTMQTALLSKMQARSENQFILATHTPLLVSPEALPNTSRFFIDQGKTAHAHFDPAQIAPDNLAKLEKELRRSTDARALLFSWAVILFEGETELGALPFWFEQHVGYTLESRGIAVFNVGGDNNFETYVRFLRLFHIPWAIVCDGLVINPPAGTKKPMGKQLEEAGMVAIPTLDGLTFEERCGALASCGVFTLATSVNEKFETLPIIQRHHPEADRLYPRSKVLQGRYIAEQYPSCPPEVAALFQQIRTHLCLT